MIHAIGEIRKAIREQNAYNPKSPEKAIRKTLIMGGGVTRTVPKPNDKFI